MPHKGKKQGASYQKKMMQDEERHVMTVPQMEEHMSRMPNGKRRMAKKRGKSAKKY